jgi:hypothetical protein
MDAVPDDERGRLYDLLGELKARVGHALEAREAPVR